MADVRFYVVVARQGVLANVGMPRRAAHTLAMQGVRVSVKTGVIVLDYWTWFWSPLFKGAVECR